MTRPLLSIIVPVFNEAENLPRFFERLIPILESVDPQWEIICIDDGSTDESLDILVHHYEQDVRIKTLTFSRNFGKEMALTAGLEHSSGQAVIPLDADLQDPPELIPDMVEQWREGYGVVLATRSERKEDSVAKRLSADWFYRVLHRISDISIPKNTGDFRLMDRAVVDAVCQMPERTRFMKGVLAWVGFPTTQIFYERPARHAGESKFRFRNLWQLALDGIFSFTTLPLKVWTYIGTAISLFAFLYASFLILKTIIYGTDVPGYPSLMVVVLFLGGIQLISLGIIGEYVGRIYRETKRRPLYVVRGQVGLDNPRVSHD